MGLALAAIWKFVWSPIGKMVMLALAVAAAIWWIRWDAIQGERQYWEAKWEARDRADNLAEEKASIAKEAADAGTAALISDLTARLAAEQAKPPVVVQSTIVKEVIRDVEKVVNAACSTIPAAFVWLRDLSFHPEYARLAKQATPEEAARDTGLKAADVAAADGEAIGQLRQFKQDCEFNLQQWDLWYDGAGKVYREWQKSVEGIRQERKGVANELVLGGTGGSSGDSRLGDDQASGATPGDGGTRRDPGAGDQEWDAQPTDPPASGEVLEVGEAAGLLAEDGR
jgi:hypothetical protein